MGAREMKIYRSALGGKSELGSGHVKRAKAAVLKGFAVELAAITALIGALVPVAMKFIEHYWPVAEQAATG